MDCRIGWIGEEEELVGSDVCDSVGNKVGGLAGSEEEGVVEVVWEEDGDMSGYGGEV